MCVQSTRSINDGDVDITSSCCLYRIECDSGWIGAVYPGYTGYLESVGPNA